MVVTGGIGHSRILKGRNFQDYASLKDHLRNSIIEEVIITGRTTTDGALAEINFAVGDTINYIAAEGQVYIRCEADDANQHDKYVYIEYQDDTGAVQTILTADLDGANSTTEVIVTGASDFYRLRQMISEVVSATGGGKAIILTDANMGGGDDIFGFIDDNFSKFNLERFFVRPAAKCISYLAHVHFHSIPKAIGAGTDTFLGSVTYTPKVLGTSDGFAEPQVAAPITEVFLFADEYDWQPCIELEPATEVIFKVGDAATAQVVHVEAVMVEDHSLGLK